MRAKRTITSVVMCICFVSSALIAQTFRGAIAGIVADTSGAAVPDAVVTIMHKGTGLTRTQNTQTAGDFNFPELPTGVYTVTTTKSGFQAFTQDVEVAVGKISSVPVTLGVASQAQSIEVQTSAASLETNDAVLNAVVNNRAIQEIPLNGRDFTQLLKLTPGYNDQGSTNGNRPTQNNYQIDGVDNNDLWQNVNAVNQGSISGVAGVLLPIDAIDQFNQQSGGNADFGRSPGSGVNVVIKSGTNQLHGTAYYFNRNEALAASAPFAPPNSANPELRNENEGFSLGGPIWKNKTFFFITFERQKFIQGNTVQATVPSAAWISQAQAALTKYGVQVNPTMLNVYNALWPTSIQGATGTVNNFFSGSPAVYKSDNGIIKIDHVFNQKHTIFARAFLGTGEATAFAGSVYPEFFQVVPSRQPNFAVVWNAVFTPRLVNQLLAGVNYFSQTFDDSNHGFNLPALGFNTGVTNPGDFGSPSINISGFTNGGVGATPQLGRIDTTGHLTDNLSWNVGSHAFKFGGEFRKQRLDVFYQRDVRGNFSFNGTAGPWANDASFSQPTRALADFLAGDIGVGLANIATGDPQRVYDLNSWSGFAADNWQVSPKLSVNLGLRYEYNGPIYESTTNKGLSTFLASSPTGLAFVGQNGFNSLYPPDKNNFAPRVGFAYSPVRGGKTVIRGGWGIYYDIINGNLFIDNRVTGDSGRGINRNPGGAAPVFSVLAPAQVVQNGVPIFPASGTPPFGAYAVNQNLRSPYTQNFNLNVQRQLTRYTLLQVGYVGNQGRKLPVNLDINQPLPDPTGLLSEQQRRPYNAQFPQFAGITELSTAGNSQYNSLQVSLRNNSWHGLTGQLQYTLGHARDDMSSVRNNTPEDSYNLRADYSNSDFDVRHVVTGYLLYEVPNFVKSRPRLGKGWQLNAFYTHQSGSPFSVTTGTNISDSFNFNDRVNLVGAPFSGVVQPANAPGNYTNGFQWINPAAFALPAAGTFGSTARNQFYGPGFNDIDFSVFKNTPITERISTQFRVEIFNLFNQLNLANPNGSFDAGAGFGLIGATRASNAGNPGIGPGEPRNVQLALKIIW